MVTVLQNVIIHNPGDTAKKSSFRLCYKNKHLEVKEKKKKRGFRILLGFPHLVFQECNAEISYWNLHLMLVQPLWDSFSWKSTDSRQGLSL